MNKNKILILIIAVIVAVLIAIMLISLNPNNRLKAISVGIDKWNSIQLSRTENVNLKLIDIKFDDYKLIIDEKNNTIYYSVINNNKNKYNPIVSYVTDFDNVKIAFLSDEITDEKVKSSYEFKVMIYNDKDYHIYNLICTDFPILNIRYDKANVNEEKAIPMEMYLFNNLTNMPNKITISGGKIKINDNNYTFSLHMITPGKNKRDYVISILNMKPKSEYTLVEADTEAEDVNHKVMLFLNNEYKGKYNIK